jgi:hypothetical protein
VPTAETLASMYVKNPPYVDKNCDEVRATPVENIVAAKELLEHNKSPAALETAVKLMTKALVQQEKATSSRRLESDPALCRSSTVSKARGNGNYGTRPDKSYLKAYKGAWRGQHDGTGADTTWSPRLSPMHVLQVNPPWACLRIRHELLRPIPPWSFQQLGRPVGNPP